MRFILLVCLFVVTTLTHRAYSDTTYTWHDNSGRYSFTGVVQENTEPPVHYQRLASHTDYTGNTAASPYCRQLNEQLSDFTAALKQRRQQQQELNPVAEQRYMRQISRLEQKIERGCR